MSVVHSILVNHFIPIKRKGWDKTFWFIDLHSTVLIPNYQTGNIPTEFYSYAKETLQLLSKLPDVCLIMYTCSHPHEIEEYLTFFKENDINFEYVNENPEVSTDIGGYGCYDKKPYMNVLFEDKAGFDAETEWISVLNLLKENYGETT